MFKVENRNECSWTRKIVYDKNLEFAFYNCKKFESEGFLYKHLLTYLMSTKENYLPIKYILTRQTKDVKSQIVLDDEHVQLRNDNDNSLMFRWTKLH